MIRAVKKVGDNLQYKDFSEEVWGLLKSDKNGWEQLSNSMADNILDKKEMPEIGTATIQKVENEVNAPIELTTENVLDKSEVVLNVEEIKAEFFNIVKENITKNTIKNYLDEANESYKANDSLIDLTEILFKKFNGNIAELKNKFTL